MALRNSLQNRAILLFNKARNELVYKLNIQFFGNLSRLF
nr:hypothetical protein RSP673_15505 [Ralstonia solanacearum P673]